jgi:hypothetical protein
MLEKPTHKWHIWFLPKRIVNAENPKELFFAIVRQENKVNE